MKKILIFSSLILLSSCSREVFVEREPNISVEAYKTYDWNKLEVTNSKLPMYNNPKLTLKIIETIDKNLAEKGVLKVGTMPDFLVDFHIFIEENKYQQEFCPKGYYREGRYNPDLVDWPFCESPEIRTFDDGTLLIDIVDAKTKQLVWRGSAGSIIDYSENISRIFTKKVKRVLRKLPVNTIEKAKKSTQIEGLEKKELVKK